jgi:hypothetical protein
VSVEDPHRHISLGPLVGLVGALLLLVSLFLNWWDGVTAWTAFEVLDLALAGLALMAILALAEAAGARLPSGVAVGAAAALPIGVVALVIVASQIVNDPPAVSGRPHATGIWLALGGALLIAAGSLMTVARITLALDFERRERQAARERPPVDDEPPPAAPPDAGPARVEPEAPTVAERRPEPGPERPS